MKKDEFWHIIDSVNGESNGDMDLKCALLKNRLDRLNEEKLKAFINHFDSADAGAYTWSLWGAAYVMHGGCSDDAFADFRATLISHGRKVYEAALNDPESLADVEYRDQEDICYEGFQYVKSDVAEDKLGEIPERSIPFPSEPSGEDWDEATVSKLYPRLSAKYSYNGKPIYDAKPKKPWWKIWL